MRSTWLDGPGRSQSGVNVSEYAEVMDEKPKMFFVSETASYHFSGGREPHLIDYCTERCEPAAVFTAMAGSTVGFQNSAVSVGMPTSMTVITFDTR